MEKPTETKSPEPPKRDQSPKRPAVGTRITRKKRAHIPECSKCGTINGLVLGADGSTYQCKTDCSKPESNNAQNSPLEGYQMEMDSFKCPNWGKKVGILDVLPKVLDTTETCAVQGERAKYNWFGLYQIVLKEKISPEINDRLRESGFRITQDFNTQQLAILDVNHTQNEIIYQGVYPAIQSLAMLDLGRAWFHCSKNATHRRPIAEILKILTKYCVAVSILVTGGCCIEIPMSEKYLEKNSDELTADIEAEYAKRNIKKKTIAFI